MPTHADDDPGDHLFNPATASPALKAAVADLTDRTGRPQSEFAGMTLGSLCGLAEETYHDDLPEFWRVWQSWQSSSLDPPAEMGDL